MVVSLAEEPLLPEALVNGIENITDHRVRLLDAFGKLFIQLVLMEVTFNHCIGDVSDPKLAVGAKLIDEAGPLVGILALLS